VIFGNETSSMNLYSKVDGKLLSEVSTHSAVSGLRYISKTSSHSEVK